MDLFNLAVKILKSSHLTEETLEEIKGIAKKYWVGSKEGKTEILYKGNPVLKKVSSKLQNRYSNDINQGREGEKNMKYFVFERDREGTCYHEFYKGKWDNKTFWKTDSLCIYDDILSDNIGFVQAIRAVIPNYDSYGVTEISAEQWNEIGSLITNKYNSSIDLYQEADRWLRKVFQEYDCFTILGI